MEKIKEYFSIYCQGTKALNEETNRFIKDGWQPMGGIAITYIDHTDEKGNQSKVVFCAQAFVR